MSELLKEYYPFADDALPSGWSEVPVGAVTAEIRSGFSSGKHNTDGIGIPHLRPMSVTPMGNVTLENVRYVAPSSGDLRLMEGDVLFTNTSSTLWVGKTGLVSKPGDWAFSNHMTRIRLREGIEAEFFAKQLHFLCRSGFFAHHCKKHVNQSSIAPSILRDKVPFRVPPLAEQHRILGRLKVLKERSKQAHTYLDEIPSQLAHTRQSLLASAFAGTLTSDWRKKNRHDRADLEAIRELRYRLWAEAKREHLITSGHRNKMEGAVKGYPKTAKLEKNEAVNQPASWTRATLEEICDATRPICYGVVQLGAETADGVPCLRTSDLKPLRLLRDAPKRISAIISAQYPRSVLQGGEVLVSVRGTLGGVAVASTDVKGWNISREIAVGATLSLLDARFVAAAIAAPQSQAWLKDVVTGVAYTGINIIDLKRLPVPIPPVAEQREIVRILETALTRIESVSSSHTTAVTALTRLEQALLGRAFRGQLVEQNPSEESAEILLARLIAEAAVKSHEPKKRMRRKSKPTPIDKVRPILTVLRTANASFSPEDLFRESGRDETDLEQIEKFYADLRSLVQDGHVKEKRPDSATVLITAKP